MTKALLVVSFGTTHADTTERTISAVENDLRAAMPDRVFMRAYTSSIVLKVLAGRGEPVHNVPEALEALLADGVTDVLIQPTHVIPGNEYEKMLSQIDPFRARFERVTVGTPLLSGEKDYLAAAQALLNALPARKAGRAHLFMGHGSDHAYNRLYSVMQQVFLSVGRDDIIVATVEGTPDFDDAAARLKELGDVKTVCCRPFMLVAGDHAKNDMSGDEPESWKSRLTAMGYTVECTVAGLGEMVGIREMYVAHAKSALRGKLWGVGVGPGDPELLTVKAVRLLREADIVAVPDRDGKGTAYDIVKSYVVGKEILPCATPMVRDKAMLAAAYDAIADTLCSLLDEGKTIAFITLGDVAVYSTYMYVHERVVARGYDAELVPGITSFCAAAARLGISLVEGRQRLMVVPAARGDISDCMDVDANFVFMKSGKEMPALRRQLRDADLLKNASMVENATMANEHVYPHLADAPEDSGYFSLVVVKREGEP